MDQIKEQRAIDMRMTRIVHDLNEFCSGNLHTDGFRFRYEIPTSGRLEGYPVVRADWQTGSVYEFIKDVAVFCNPVAKYFAMNNRVSIYKLMSSWRDWTQCIRYCRFNESARFPNGKTITANMIRENVGMEPVGNVIFKKQRKNLTTEEYDWWFWIENGHVDEWKEDWYVLESVYLLRLYGQLLRAMEH